MKRSRPTAENVQDQFSRLPIFIVANLKITQTCVVKDGTRLFQKAAVFATSRSLLYIYTPYIKAQAVGRSSHAWHSGLLEYATYQ